MTPDVHSDQTFFQSAAESIQGLQQLWLRREERLPEPPSLQGMIQTLEQISLGAESRGHDHPVHLCGRIQSLLEQIIDTPIRADALLQTQISEALGTLTIMIQALSVSGGPAQSVLDRLSEGISPTLDRAEQRLRAFSQTAADPQPTSTAAPVTPVAAHSGSSSDGGTDLGSADELPTSTSESDEPEIASGSTPEQPQSTAAQAESRDHHDFVWLTGLIFVLALVMRVWNLDQFEAPVFDEVYFPVFAENYLDGESFYDVHPPLGKYLIALGILIFGRGELGYRILPALFGALIPVLVAGVAYRLTYWRNYALLAGTLMLTDGLFLVESRYGLMNGFLVAFGFAAQIFMLTGLTRKGIPQAILFICSGLMLGAAIGVKFNGLFFCVLFIALMLMAWIVRGIWPQHLPRLGVLARITEVKWWHYLFCFILPAFLIYAIIWIPHLLIMPATGAELRDAPGWLPGVLEPPIEFLRGVIQINQSLIGGHTGSNLVVTDDTPVHPYCSTSLWPVVREVPILKALLPQRIWSAGAWSWPILGRPVGYYFNNTEGVWRAVHALGNPLLWWFSILSVLALSVRGLRQLRGVPAYLLLGFAANYLPWFAVSRCVFIYHYMSALAFAIMAFAWVVCCYIHDLQRWFRIWLGFTAVTLAIAGLIFFAPVWYGFPLRPGAFYARMWFRPNPIPFFCFTDQQCQQAQIKIPPIPGLNWI